MREDNIEITIPGVEAIAALREIEYVLISLHRIGSYFSTPVNEELSDEEYIKYAVETTRFIDDNNVTQRLAKARSLISSGFNDEMGDDGMGDLERDFQDIKLWERPRE